MKRLHLPKHHIVCVCTLQLWCNRTNVYRVVRKSNNSLRHNTFERNALFIEGNSRNGDICWSTRIYSLRGMCKVSEQLTACHIVRQLSITWQFFQLTFQFIQVVFVVSACLAWPWYWGTTYYTNLFFFSVVYLPSRGILRFSCIPFWIFFFFCKQNT